MDRADHAVPQHKQQQGEQNPHQDSRHESYKDHRAENDQHDGVVDRLEAPDILVQPLVQHLEGKQEHRGPDQQLGHKGNQPTANCGNPKQNDC